ncbi:MAG: hypothetical protein IKW85_08255 [Muribaculaceae bacterium]|nr:hypothetical protein [Muribaculaceae bacterium]
MKKVFTLLFCVVATAFAASANNDALIDRCINYVLGNDTNIAAPQTQELDANNDGVINITDVTTLINMKLQDEKVQKSSRHRVLKPQVLIDKVLNESPSKTTITTITDAINKDLEEQ